MWVEFFISFIFTTWYLFILCNTVLTSPVFPTVFRCISNNEITILIWCTPMMTYSTLLYLHQLMFDTYNAHVNSWSRIKNQCVNMWALLWSSAWTQCKRMKLVRTPESFLLCGVAEYIKMCNKIQFTKAQSEFHINN